MQKKGFLFKEACRAGWKKFTENIRFFLKLSALLALIGLIIGIVLRNITVENYLVDFLVSIPVFVLTVFFLMRSIKMSFSLNNGISFSIKDFFSLPDSNALYFIGGLILYSFIVPIGLFLFIIPGIIWYLMFSMFPFIIIDKNISPVEALKESARLTRNTKLKLLGFYLLTASFSVFIITPVIKLLSLLSLFFNFLSVFLVLLILTNIYEQLKDSSGAVNKI